MRTILMCAFLGLPLSGCVETVARASVEASYLADSASNYVHEVHLVRQWVRFECMEIFKDRVRKARSEGKPEEATALLVAGYPPVVTVSILREIYKDPKSILSTPFGCSTLPEAEPEAGDVEPE